MVFEYINFIETLLDNFSIYFLLFTSWKCKLLRGEL